MKILVAENDLSMRESLNASLTKAGFETILTANGREALERMTSDHSVQLAILDWDLPEMSGLDVCVAMRSQTDGPLVYIILLTGKSGRENVVQGLTAGADDFVTKPVAFDELRARLRAGERIIRLEISLRRQIQQLQEANKQVAQLQGFIPICAWCKKIRDDSKYWQEIDDYLQQHLDTAFTHSICPTCLSKKFAEIIDHSHSELH